MEEKSREKQARRLAERRGWILRKSRIDGTWSIIDPVTGSFVGRAPKGHRAEQGLTLRRVEQLLRREG